MYKVLIVMEQDGLRDLLLSELQKDCEITVCGNAVEGEELLRYRPDVLILDLFLPGINGFTFLRENRVLLPPVIIALSTLLSPKILRELKDLGITSVVRKPCTVDVVTSCLNISR